MENLHNVIEFQQARNFSQKMSATFDFIRQNFKSFAKSMLFIAGPPVILSSIFIGDIFNRFMGLSVAASQSQFGNSSAQQMQDYFSSSTFWLQILGIILFAWIGGVITIATTYAYMRIYSEKKTTAIEVSEVWARVRQTFWMHFGTLTLYVILMMAFFVILAIPLGIVMGLAGVISPFLAIIGVLAFYLFVFMFSINMSLIFIIREAENIGFFDALTRLFYLIKNKMWSTFGIGIINVLIQSTVSMVFFLPWYISFIISLMHRTSGDAFEEPSSIMTTVNSIFLILYFVCNTLLYSLPMIALAFQYYNLVELKESRGLLSNIESFGESTAQPQNDEHY
ncbi:MAG TPA: hypothetical protein VIN08_22935 [Ohtaekwangia sp.]|uniref:hypothetical protein n=1 Tax=Ohtaekwangia sp. TaxID=2066019 RepID=UPI002F93B441